MKKLYLLLLVLLTGMPIKAETTPLGVEKAVIKSTALCALQSLENEMTVAATEECMAKQVKSVKEVLSQFKAWAEQDKAALQAAITQCVALSSKQYGEHSLVDFVQHKVCLEAKMSK